MYTSESTGLKTRLPITFRVTVKSNVFDLADSSIRKGPNSIAFGKCFSLWSSDQYFLVQKTRIRKKMFWLITLKLLERNS